MIAAPLAAAYVGLVVLANWLASRYTVSVGFGLIAPAGVYCIGFVLCARDWLQQLRGLRFVLPLMLVAGGASYVVGVAAGWTRLQTVAVASVVAFLVSETVETVVFTPIRNSRTLTGGVALSATVGNAIDGALFLWLAFGSLAFFAGNFVGKLEMIALGVLLTACRRVFVPVAS